MIAVIICNVIKCVVIFLTFWSHKDAIIITFDDVIVNYLNCSNDTTRDRCMIEMKNVRQKLSIWIFDKKFKMWNATTSSTQHAMSHNRRWFCETSKRKWYLIYIFIVFCFEVVDIFLNIDVTNFEKLTSNQNMSWVVDFDESNSQTFITHSALSQRDAIDFTISTIISNLSQIVLFFIYLIYNDLFICMLLTVEWNEYSQKCQVLRIFNSKDQ